ncbi:MAG: hypothetical protein M3R58_07840 [Pseudomonadota bacterium]|nr:hypothetical protein [Pseudomonadota bacterium]
MRTAARLAVFVPLLAALGWASAAAVGFARADSAVFSASREMGAWAAARTQPASGTWDSVRERLERAEQLSPSDPTPQELMGLLDSRRTDSAERMAQGVTHLTRALRLRPGSPYTWANLAEVKYLQGSTGGDFELALRRAADLGPAEPEVQRMVGNFGLAVWDEVAVPTRQAIDRMVRAGLRRNPLEMLQISERRGRLAEACRHLVGISRAPDPKWYSLCQSTETTP